MEKNYFRGLLTSSLEDSNVTLTGIPYDEGCSCGSGASEAPQRLRELSSFLPPLSMDGDLLTNIKLFDFGHLDAHPDICDVYDGSIYSHACTNRRSIDYGYKPENVVLVGIRGFEAQEIEYFSKHPELKVYTTNLCYELGIKEVVNQLKEKFDDRYAIYLSYDIDINDPSYAPGTGTPEAFGLGSRMVLELVLGLIENLPVKAFDIVEVSPNLDCNDITTWLALKTIYEVFKVLINKENKR